MINSNTSRPRCLGLLRSPKRSGAVDIAAKLHGIEVFSVSMPSRRSVLDGRNLSFWLKGREVVYGALKGDDTVVIFCVGSPLF